MKLHVYIDIEGSACIRFQAICLLAVAIPVRDAGIEQCIDVAYVDLRRLESQSIHALVGVLELFKACIS